MPAMRQSHAIFPAPALGPVSERARVVDFIENEGLKVVGIDKGRDSLTVEVIRRQIKPARRYDEDEGKMVTEKSTKDKVFIFSLEASGRATTTGSPRDFALLGELLMRCGEPQGDQGRIATPDLLRWGRGLCGHYEHAQFGGAIVDNLFLDPRNIGRYGFKTVDNRVDWAYLDSVAGQIAMLKFGFFHEGCKRTASLTSKGTLTVSSQDVEDAEHFLNEQSAEVWNVSV